LLEKNYAGNDNYVVAEEYPYALKHGKTIVAVEAEALDRDRFNQTFPQGVSHYITMDGMEEVLGKLLLTFDTAYLQDNNEKCYLLGRAFQKGIMVERDVARAEELWELAAGNGSVKAMQILAIHYESMFEFDKAHYWLQKNIALLDAKSESGLTTVALLRRLSGVYFEKGKFGIALETALEAVRIGEDAYGKWNPYVSDIYSDISGIYSRLKDNENAAVYAKKAIDIRKRMSMEVDSSTYTMYAFLLQDEGIYDEALLPWSLKAVDLAEQLYGEEHKETAMAYIRLGRNYVGLNALEKAEEFFNKALNIQKKLLVPNHPDTLTTLGQLAGIYFRQGDYQRALDDFRYCAKQWEQIYGSENIDTAGFYTNISVCLFYMGERIESMEWLKKSTEIHVRLLGSDHPTVELLKNIKNRLGFEF
jgi:tetratricopeptide (TPR) repeat protein